MNILFCTDSTLDFAFEFGVNHAYRMVVNSGEGGLGGPGLPWFYKDRSTNMLPKVAAQIWSELAFLVKFLNPITR